MNNVNYSSNAIIFFGCFKVSFASQSISQNKLIKMKKLTRIAFKVCMLFAVMPLQLIAQNATANIAMLATTKESDDAAKTTTSNVLLLRLNEIKAMDKSNLSSSEKKGLRTELKSIKSNMKANGGGLYLSVGAIIIIILLLILLL